jgi:ABC-type nitrate/sulfonate/bicarbonate transport system permease component
MSQIVAELPRRSLGSSTARRIGGSLHVPLAILGVLGIWQVLSMTISGGEFVLPSPIAVFEQMWKDRALYPPNIETTLNEALKGLAWGVGLAIVIAVVFVQIPILEKGLMGAALATYCVPIIVVGPIVAIVFSGETPKVVLAAMAVFFPTLIGVLVGLRSADGTSLAVVRAFGGGSVTQLRKVRLRAALPSFFAALKIAGAAAVLGAIIGEYLGGDSGLGVAMIAASQSLEVERVWGLAIVSSALALVLYGAAALLARLLTVAPAASNPTSQSVAPREPGGRAWPIVAVLRRIGYALLALVVSVALWIAFINVFNLDPYFAKTPSDVFDYLFTAPASAANRADLLDGLRVTMVDSIPGLLLGVTAGVVLAAMFVRVIVLDRALMPVFIALSAAPIVALTPLITLTFGRDILGITVIVALVSFFPTLVNVMRGFKSAPAESLDLIRAAGGTAVIELRKVQVPSALPSFFASLKIAVPGALFGTLLAEWIATGDGIGNQILVASTTAKYDEVWAGVVLITAATVALYEIVGLVESFVLRRYSPDAVSH